MISHLRKQSISRWHQEPLKAQTSVGRSQVPEKGPTEKIAFDVVHLTQVSQLTSPASSKPDPVNSQKPKQARPSSNQSAPGTITILDCPKSPEECALPRTKFGSQEMKEVQKRAKTDGTRVSTLVVGKHVHQVQIHGAQAAEFDQVQKALQALAKQDSHGLILPHLKDVYVSDSLGLNRTGKTAAGASFLEENGESSVLLSRSTGQGAEINRLEQSSHVKGVLYHEIGHVVDNRYGLSSKGRGFGAGASEDFISKKAEENKKEDFAETFSKFFGAATSEDAEGASWGEVAQLMKFGCSDALKTKIDSIAEDLTPDKEVHVQAMAEVRDSGLGPAVFVQGVLKDKDSIRAWESKVLGKSPSLPRSAISNHMKRLARLFP